MKQGDRIAAIETRLAAIEKQARGVDYVERELLDAARQYARLTKLGYYTEQRGDETVRVMLCSDDAKSMARHYEGKMQYLAVDLLRAETS